MPHARVQSTQLWYTDAGVGEILLLIHGFPLDGRIWENVIPHLLPYRRVITLDLRGFGNSDPTGPFSMKQLALDVAGFSMIHKLGPCAMAGLSMGGYVLQELARQAPETISHLILVDTRAEADNPEGQNKRNAMAKTALEQGAKAIADQMYPNMLAPGHDPKVGVRLREIMESQRPETLAHACIAMRDREDFVNLLSSLDMPVSLIVGEHDAITPPTLARAIHEKLKTGRLFEIPGAGHMSPLEKPHAVADALLKLTEGKQ